MTPKQAMEQAVGFFDAGDLPRAEALCRRIIQAQPEHHPAYFQLGLIAAQVGKLQVAENMIVQALQYSPDSFVYHRAIGEIYRRLGRLDKAVHHGRQATKFAPEDAESFYNLGIALADAGELEEAISVYRKVLENKADHGMAANNLGTALEKLGDKEGAVEFYQRAIDINPNHAEAQNNLGAILSERGDIEEAKKCFSAAIENNPSFVFAHHNLSTLKKYIKDDPHLAALTSLLEVAPQMPEDMRLRFWFSIGKAWEDVGQYKESFEAYQRGNVLKRKEFSYDVEKTEESIEDIISGYNQSFAGKKTQGFEDETPVFIVGMPRSGSTLIEQILSSHSKVCGAGELRYFADVIEEEKELDKDVSYINWLLKADDDTLTRIGKNYVDRLRALDNKALRISDKMPGNFFYVGLIHKALPQAKIIHSMREPMDVCISNYSRLFNETMPFAYDLEELGRYHRSCDDMMAHWKKVLPAGTILDMKYEDNVADLETQARKLIAFCGLEWEESCLEFHKNKRHVKTASIAQVRQPIYKSSVARWERFKDQLGPLQKILDGEKV